MNGIGFIVAVLVMLPVGNRLRLINWKTARAYAVLQYLFQAGVALWVLYDSCAGAITGYQWALLLFVAVWLLLTREDWAHGMPGHIQNETRPLR